jgi:hypothetical protein
MPGMIYHLCPEHPFAVLLLLHNKRLSCHDELLSSSPHDKVEAREPGNSPENGR